MQGCMIYNDNLYKTLYEGKTMRDDYVFHIRMLESFLTGDNALHVSRSMSDTAIEFDRLDIFDGLLKTAEFVTVKGPILAIACRGGKSAFMLLQQILNGGELPWS